MAEFNLLDQRWIACIDLEGKSQEVGMKEFIISAHRLKRFAHPYPIVNASYIFMLEALLLSVYSKEGIQLNDVDNWIDLFSAGKFEESIFETYFQEWNSRFFLFDDQYPFFQNWVDDEKAVGTAMKLMPHYSGGTGGNTATLFDHHTEEEGITFSIEEAANYLLPAYYFGAGGRIIGRDYFSDAMTANALSFFIEGDNLFETLILNLLPYPEVADVASKEQDRPIWEQDQPFHAGDREFVKEGKNLLYQPYGLMDLLTWPGRKIKLLKDEDERVRTIQMHAGLKTNQTYFPWFGYNERGNYLRANENRAVWRSYDVLVQLKKLVTGEGQNRPPQPIDWLSEIIQDDYLDDRNFDLHCLGMAKQAGKQKTNFYCDQTLPLPAEFFNDRNLITEITNALSLAEGVSKSLYGASAQLVTLILASESDLPEGRSVEKNDKANLISHLGAEQVFWAALEPQFYTLITRLPKNREESYSVWKNSIQAAAREALEHAIRLAGESVKSMKAAVKARSILERGLIKNLGDLNKEETDE